MNCKNCGAPLRDDQNFCSYCGAKVEKQQYEYNDPSFITFENIVGNNFNNNFEEEHFSSKSKFVALFLALFIGYGSHSFYLGHTKKGIIQLSISLIGFIVGLISLGCAKNLVDSEMILSFLKRNDLEIVNDSEQAELVIINTCGFIESSKQESINTILEYVDSNKILVLSR